MLVSMYHGLTMGLRRAPEALAGLGDVVFDVDAVVEGFVSDGPEVPKLVDD